MAQVSWPSIEEWNALGGNWPSFSYAVGCIDGTPHEIFRPQVEPLGNSTVDIDTTI